jgi:two-component sensor histidine kinase
LAVYVPGNYEALFAWARRGAVDQREWTYLRRDGSRLPVSVSVSVTRADDGQISGFICIAIDISARKAHEDLQRTALMEKETLLKEVYHRVKNNLQVVSSLFNLQLRGLPQGAARATLQQSAERVRAMALVHEKLCRSNNLETIDILAYVRELCDSLATATGADERGITVTLDIEPVEIGLDASVPLGLLLNELICNSLKHAFPGERAGTVHVRLARLANGAAVLEVRDDGIGMTIDPAGAHPATLGLRLARTLARQLGGALQFRGEGGTAVSLVFALGDGRRTARLESIGWDSGGRPNPVAEVVA